TLNKRLSLFGLQTGIIPALRHDNRRMNTVRSFWEMLCALVLAAFVGLTANSLQASTIVKLGAVTQIFGPQDLDLDGNFVYAINFSPDDPPRTVHGVTFLPDNKPIPGATLIGPQNVI